jgi:hypothetical protein
MKAFLFLTDNSYHEKRKVVKLKTGHSFKPLLICHHCFHFLIDNKLRYTSFASFSFLLSQFLDMLGVIYSLRLVR